MIVGHVGVALGAKGARVDVPLWLLLAAAFAPDLAHAGVEIVGAREASAAVWSHSIAAVALLAIAFAIVTWRVARDRGAAALVAALVVLHVLADYLTGLKPTWAGGPTIGLQLYAHPVRDFVIEAVVIALGWLLYVRWPADRAPRTRPAVSLLMLLLIVQAIADARIRLAGRLIP